MTQRKNSLLLIFIILSVITVIWVIQLLQGYEPFVDQATRGIVARLENSFLFEIFQYITHLGSSFFLYPFVITFMIVLFIWYRDWLPGILFGGGVYVTHLLNQGIKLIITRDRPSIAAHFNAEGYSFPSGHAMISIVCYGLLAYFISKKLKKIWAKRTVQFFFAILIILIGISRYVINVHFLTDVLAGFFIGSVLLIGYLYLYERVQKKRGKEM